MSFTRQKYSKSSKLITKPIYYQCSVITFRCQVSVSRRLFKERLIFSWVQIQRFVSSYFQIQEEVDFCTKFLAAVSPCLQLPSQLKNSRVYFSLPFNHSNSCLEFIKFSAGLFQSFLYVNKLGVYWNTKVLFGCLCLACFFVASFLSCFVFLQIIAEFAFANLT